jgi:hypothetical protein
VALRPRKSITSVLGPIRGLIASLEPTATILPPAMATASATESVASTVRILPLINTRSAGVTWAVVGPSLVKKTTTTTLVTTETAERRMMFA